MKAEISRTRSDQDGRDQISMGEGCNGGGGVYKILILIGIVV